MFAVSGSVTRRPFSSEVRIISAVTGNRLNMVNLVAVPLLIGIDVDYGIFVVNLARVRAIRDMTPAELAHHIEPATHAVLICAGSDGQNAARQLLPTMAFWNGQRP